MNRQQIAKMLEDMQRDRGGDCSEKPEIDESSDLDRMVTVRGIGRMMRDSARKGAISKAKNIIETIKEDVTSASDGEVLTAYLRALEN